VTRFNGLGERPWRRVVVKVGTSSLTDAAGRIHPPLLWALARGLGMLQHALKCRVVLVSSGAGAAGREQLGLTLPLTLPKNRPPPRSVRRC
jgi:glutamate 5-kinase